MDRVRSTDLPTIDATLASLGAVARPAVELPDDASVPTETVLRLTIDGTVRHVRFEEYAGTTRAMGAFDAPDLVRSPGDGENRLRQWVEAQGLATGRTVHLDVIQPEFAYGLRAPGEELVYDAPAPPNDSLASIAEDLCQRE